MAYRPPPFNPKASRPTLPGPPNPRPGLSVPVPKQALARPVASFVRGMAPAPTPSPFPAAPANHDPAASLALVPLPSPQHHAPPPPVPAPVVPTSWLACNIYRRGKLFLYSLLLSSFLFSNPRMVLDSPTWPDDQHSYIVMILIVSCQVGRVMTCYENFWVDDDDDDGPRSYIGLMWLPLL